MKKTLLRLSVLGMLLMLCVGVHAQTSYDNVDATFSWLIGNEEKATITGEVTDAVKAVKRKVGTGLTQSQADYKANIDAGILAEYNPNTSNPGNIPDAMVEYSIKMAKGTTFTLTSVEYDAVKNGTDNATYSWSYTVDGTESEITTVPKEKILRNNGNNKATASLRHTETITAAGGQVVTVRFYISGFSNGKKCAIGNLNIIGKVNGTPVVRSFKDFKVDFRFQKSDEQKYTVILPTTGELPAGITISNVAINGQQHGASKATIVVPVDGPVQFTIGACQYGNNVTVTDANGGDPIVVNNNTGCENTPASIDKATYEKYVVYTYNNETPTTLTFTLNGYMPFFFAEACDFIESCDVTYFDTDGKKLIGVDTVDGSSELKYKYGASDVTIPDGSAFRGWFSSAALAAVKVPEGTSVDADLALYAKASEIEKAAVGKVFNYDLTKPYFYVEDHELISVDGGKYHNNHGWVFGNGNSFSVQVAGNAQVVVGLCQYSSDAPIVVTDANNKEVATIASAKVAADGATATVNYAGEATTLKFTMGGTAYIHKVSVYNVETLPAKDEATGYFIVGANDGAGFITALNSANAEGTAEKPAKIFLPNGLYDLGNTCLTSVSSNVTIIGESQNGVIIKNTPDEEGIGVTATLLFTGSNIYLQDLSLNCSAEKCASPAASRCVTIQDKGTQNICKNVSLLSGQDTYYSNGGATQKAFFDKCYITGTVDFLCGGGDVVFNNTTLYVNARSSANVIAAPNTDANTQWGYLMLNCTIDGDAGQANKYNMCRPWNGSPAATWINTTCKLMPSAAAYTEMTNGLVLRFHEYNTKDAEGNAITGHKLDACKGAEGSHALYIDEATANTYTIDNVLGSWAATAQQQAAQLEAPAATYANGNVTWTPANNGATAYLIEKNGAFAGITAGSSFAITIDAEKDNLTIRAANGRGGFGEAKQVEGTATGIHAVKAAIERGEKVIYNLAGQRVDAAYKGLVISDGVKIMQK